MNLVAHVQGCHEHVSNLCCTSTPEFLFLIGGGTKTMRIILWIIDKRVHFLFRVTISLSKKMSNNAIIENITYGKIKNKK